MWPTLLFGVRNPGSHHPHTQSHSGSVGARTILPGRICVADISTRELWDDRVGYLLRESAEEVGYHVRYVHERYVVRSSSGMRPRSVCGCFPRGTARYLSLHDAGRVLGLSHHIVRFWHVEVYRCCALARSLASNFARCSA
jgi:hypothetical protein